MNDTDRRGTAPVDSRPVHHPRVIGADHQGLQALNGSNVPPPASGCCSSVELRYCRENNAVAWQCTRCNRLLSRWIAHRLLQGINLAQLPVYVRVPKRHRPGQGVLL